MEIKTIKSNVYSIHLIKMFICLINKESVIIMCNICQYHSYYYLSSGEDLCTIYLLCLILLYFLFPEDHVWDQLGIWNYVPCIQACKELSAYIKSYVFLVFNYGTQANLLLHSFLRKKKRNPQKTNKQNKPMKIGLKFI